MLQGWDVLLQRLHDFQTALSSATAPPSTAAQPQQQTPPFASFILSHPLDAQSGLLIVEVVATSHRGKPFIFLCSELTKQRFVRQTRLMLQSPYCVPVSQVVLQEHGWCETGA